jgi:hypothetical protein
MSGQIDIAYMQEIKAWLQSKDYIEGVRLYLEHGTDENLIELFTSEARTDYKAQRLERALRELAKGDPQPKKPDPVPVATVNAWPEETDDILSALKADAMRKFKEMQHIRSQLLLLPDDHTRGEAAHNVLRLDDEITEIWRKRDYYKEHGRLPAEQQDPYVTDPLRMGKRMETLRRYIRRERDHLAKDPGNVAAAVRRKKFIKEYNFYAERLGGDHIQEEDGAGQKAEE